MNIPSIGLGLVALAALGAGCLSKPVPPQTAPSQPSVAQPVITAPTLAITHPQNGATVTADAVTVLGTSDAERVLVNGIPAKLENGRFSAAISLSVGANAIRVEASGKNGTTHAVISVRRETSAPSSATQAPSKTPTKPKTTVPSFQAPTPVAAPSFSVTFVSGELAVSAVLDAYGANLAWSKTGIVNFKAYAVVKSVTDSSPYYPKQSGVHYTYDKDSTQWSDRNVEKGKRTYYRVCAIATDDSVRCGNVTSVLR